MGKFILLYHDFSTRGLIGEGRHFKFYLNGNLICETPIDLNCMSSEEVDILSVLVTNGLYIELAYNIDGKFSKRPYRGTLPELIRQINTLNGLVFTGVQNGKVENDICNQYLFAFKKGYLKEDIIK